MEKCKYTTIFSSTIKPLVSEDKDKYLSLASMVNIADFIPNVDTDKNIDLLPIAFNACVANRVNKNDDVIDSSVAEEIHKNFINKPINIEHNREKVVGVILTAGFSEFGTDQVLSKEAVANKKGPFNITLGGVVWKVVNNALADLIEESGDPTSEHYRQISASWELGFSEYNLVVLPEGEKNIENGKFITDASEVQRMEDHLKSFGGEGKLDSGERIYRQVVAEVVPLGIGLTESPAADVKGVAVKTDEDRNPPVELNSSQNNQNNVKINNKVMKMKIEKLTDINDESLKELSASSISDFIESELEKAAEQYKKEMTEAETALDAANEKADTLQKEHDALSKEIDEVKSSLETLEKANQDREAEEKFNQRMSLLDDTYELADEDRAILAADIKDMEEEVFSNYQEKLSVLLKEKNKEHLKQQAEATAETEAKEAEVKVEEEAVASEEVTEVLDQVIENAEVEAAEIPESTEVEEPTLYDKYSKAFGLDQFDIRSK
tara:strand:- start:4846 stop:6330 length:1485 start_codon:yes stop_codon:yes gene_type:complete